MPLFWNIRDRVILKVLLRVLARQNPNFLSCAVPAQRSTNIILYSLFFFNLGQYRMILSADTASEVRHLPERCLSRKAGIVRCCLSLIQPYCFSLNSFRSGFIQRPFSGTGS